MDYEIKSTLEECEPIAGIKIVKKVYTNVDTAYLTMIGNKLTSYEGVIALLALENEEKCNLLFACSKNFKK